jgi:hypothetical protein
MSNVYCAVSFTPTQHSLKAQALEHILRLLKTIIMIGTLLPIASRLISTKVPQLHSGSGALTSLLQFDSFTDVWHYRCSANGSAPILSLVRALGDCRWVAGVGSRLLVKLLALKPRNISAASSLLPQMWGLLGM